MTNNTTTQTISAQDESFYVAAEKAAVEKFNVPAGVARAAFIELRAAGPHETFEGRVLTACNRAVDIAGSAIHPKALAGNIVQAFRWVA